MTILTVRHATVYRYKQPVGFGEHRMMLRPREGHDQRLLEATLEITPRPSELRWLHDVFGNSVAVARFNTRATELRFVSTVKLDHLPLHALDFQLEPHATTYPFSYGIDELPDLARSIERHYPDPDHEVDRWARRFLTSDGPTSTFQMLEEMTAAIRREFAYIARFERGIQEPTRTLKLKSGTCRDFALLMIEAARSLGLAARFVSGYIHVPKRPGETKVGGGSTHAWARIYLPGAGWVEFDPTNGIVGNRDLIRVAVARDPRQAIPLHGTWFGFPATSLGMTVEVSVTAGDEAATSHDGAAPEDDATMERPAASLARQAARRFRNRSTLMQIRAGFEISYNSQGWTPMLLALSIHPSRMADLLGPHQLQFSPSVGAIEYRDGFGNVCHRIVAPPGMLTISTDFIVTDPGTPDPYAPYAVQHNVDQLPDDTLVYLLGSRYCETDRLSDTAWSLFGNTPLGWARVQAICDYVHNRITFGYEHADPTRGAWGGHQDRRGVCRDFAHLAVTLCRCMNIPARYCTGYLGDIGIPPMDAPMDFSAWFEAYLGGHWHTFDARFNTPRIGRILMARGRDATDVALSTQFGPCALAGFQVTTYDLPAS